uniref:Uncharacterized protein n=1 Tax=Anopheles merus TaxID=30066 RepID=A0A182VLG3_ANOME
MEGEYTPESCGDQQAHRADSDLLAGSTPRRGGVHKSETPTILSPAAGPSKSRREDPLQDDQRVEPLAYSTLRQNGGRSASPPEEPKDAYLASWYELEMEKLQLERKELEVLKRELALRQGAKEKGKNLTSEQKNDDRLKEVIHIHNEDVIWNEEDANVIETDSVPIINITEQLKPIWQDV